MSQDNVVEAEHNSLGWIFRNGGLSSGPHDDCTLDIVKVAEELSVEPKLVLQAKLHDLSKPLAIHELLDIISSTVKRDNPSKAVVFLTMLLTYTDEDQGNVGLQAESSTGKSYLPLELIEYFPDEDVIIYGGASPTSFFHEAGIWDDERKAIVINLEKKILIFLDQPHYMLLEKLRALLSHDRKELQYKITDKSEKRGLRTKTVIIKGYPTVIFCAAKFSMDEQEKTRLFLLSPDSSEEKVADGLYLIANRLCDRDAFREHLKKDVRRIWLKQRVHATKTASIRNVIIEDPDSLCQKFIAKHKHLLPRYQRDFPRLIGLIKAHAILNQAHREQLSENCIKASQEDIEEGFQLYEEIATPNELGISPRIFEVYEKVILPNSKDDGLDRQSILTKYREVFHRALSPNVLRTEIIPLLEGTRLIATKPDPADARRTLVYPTDACSISNKNNRANIRGVDQFD